MPIESAERWYNVKTVEELMNGILYNAECSSKLSVLLNNGKEIILSKGRTNFWEIDGKSVQSYKNLLEKIQEKYPEIGIMEIRLNYFNGKGKDYRNYIIENNPFYGWIKIKIFKNGKRKRVKI